MSTQDHHKIDKVVLKMRHLHSAQQIVDDHTDQQKAQDWLAGVAGQSDKVKDLVMQELWRKEDFQST
jgi:hypothetical protein